MQLCNHHIDLSKKVIAKIFIHKDFAYAQINILKSKTNITVK